MDKASTTTPTILQWVCIKLSAGQITKRTQADNPTPEGLSVSPTVAARQALSLESSSTPSVVVERPLSLPKSSVGSTLVSTSTPVMRKWRGNAYDIKQCIGVPIVETGSGKKPSQQRDGCKILVLNQPETDLATPVKFRLPRYLLPDIETQFQTSQKRLERTI